jgi:hypothetical protein
MDFDASLPHRVLESSNEIVFFFAGQRDLSASQLNVSHDILPCRLICCSPRGSVAAVPGRDCPAVIRFRSHLLYRLRFAPRHSEKRPSNGESKPRCFGFWNGAGRTSESSGNDWAVVTIFCRFVGKSIGIELSCVRICPRRAFSHSLVGPLFLGRQGSPLGCGTAFDEIVPVLRGDLSPIFHRTNWARYRRPFWRG